jgi:hypothetical protein
MKNTYDSRYGEKIFIANINRFHVNGMDETVKLEALLIKLSNGLYVDINKFNTENDIYRIAGCAKDNTDLDIFLDTTTDIENGLYIDEETLLSYNAFINKPYDMSNKTFKELIYGKRKQAK